MTKKVRFSHPLYDTFYETELDTDITFKEIQKMLIKEGFIAEKKGGYQFIIDDRLCTLGEPLQTYIPSDCADVLEVRVHALLVILT